MRIALVNNFFPPRPTGSSHLTDELARSFAASGHEVLVVTASYGDAPAHEIVHGSVDVHRLPAWRLPRSRLAFDYDIRFVLPARNRRRFNRMLDDFAPEVIHQHGQFFDLAFLSSWYARRHNVPHLTSVHARLEHDNPVIGSIFAAIDRTCIRLPIDLARSNVVIMDKRMLEYVRRRYKTPTSRLVFIPVGIDTTRFTNLSEHNTPNNIRKAYGLDERPILLSVGHITPFRNRVALVRAVAALQHRGLNFQCVIVGGEHDTRYRQEANRLGIADDLIVTGAVTKGEITQFLAEATMEMHDLQREGLGTASLEAMASGLPVISDIDPDNFPGLRLLGDEHLVLVRHGDEAQLADEAARLLTDPIRRQKIGSAGRAFVLENFSIERVAQQHLEAYESLLATTHRE